MTSDPIDIPAPPPGWAIVPADDARLDCLPGKEGATVYNGLYMRHENKWVLLNYIAGSEAIAHDIVCYALPIAPPADAEPAPQLIEHTPETLREFIKTGMKTTDCDTFEFQLNLKPSEADELLKQACEGTTLRTRYIAPEEKAPIHCSVWDAGFAAQKELKGLLGSKPAPPFTTTVPCDFKAGLDRPRPQPWSLPEPPAGRETGVKSQHSATDPKGEAGKAKAPMALLPPEALRQVAWAHGNGAAKYGPYNWREVPVSATTYVSAMLRHIGQYLDGEDADAESGLSHLAHVIASANILIDAKHCGTLVDDRPKRPA